VALTTSQPMLSQTREEERIENPDKEGIIDGQ
jgi:hypothetical protein